MDQTKLLYAPSHEWLAIEGENATVGITLFAVEQLTDITYIELPSPGTKIHSGKPFGVIESVKSANDLYAPCEGEVLEVNQAVASDPSILNQDPYEKGWMIKIRMIGTLNVSNLMDKAHYDKKCAEEAH